VARSERAPKLTATDPPVDMPGHLLRRCHQIAVAIFLDECQAYDLTPLQYVALLAVAGHGALDKAAIGGVAALDRTTVAVVVRNLEARGFVSTRPSEQDRRATLVEVTDKGRALLKSVRPEVASAQERTVAPLTPTERAELMRLLRKIAEGNNLLSRAPRRTPRHLGG
jgi:DNA-binding MarR family transcriptional regulator